MNVIFMGTPEFGAISLAKLIATNHKVVAVFTQEPKPKGRGMKLTKSPVHIIAEDNNIDVYTPKTLRSEDVLYTINKIDADVIVVVAYGFIIPKAILESKKYGCLNVHPSKLPRFRGAAPLQHTIISGDKETAVCIMQMDEGLDTGDIILKEEFPIEDDITLPQLHNICANKGGDLLLEVLDNIESLPRTKQLGDGVTYAHKLTKEDGGVNWSASAVEIERKIRGMNPWPGVSASFLGHRVKILKAIAINSDSNVQGEIGAITSDFSIICGRGLLKIELLQKAGSNAMRFEEFLRGVRQE